MKEITLRLLESFTRLGEKLMETQKWVISIILLVMALNLFLLWIPKDRWNDIVSLFREGSQHLPKKP